MRRYSLVFLALLSIILILTTNSHDTNTTHETNARTDCQNGPNGLEWVGAQQTCIESREFVGERCFFTFVPECAEEDAPLVFDIHGFSYCPYYSTIYTGWIEKANENCFVLVLPLGVTDPEIADETCWGFPGGLKDDNVEADSCCCRKNNEPVVTDDEAFLRQVAAVTTQELPIKTSNKVTIDTKRIYMAGHSNGCIASISMAAMHSDLVAAVGCHSGTAIVPFPESYSPTPMFLIRGKNDKVVDYNGGFFFGALQVHGLVSDANGCTVSNQEYLLGDDNNVTEYTSSSCTNNASVVLYAIDGVGHFPYVDAYAEGFNEEGNLPTKVDTTQLAWDFMKSNSLEDAPELIVYGAGETGGGSSEDAGTVIGSLEKSYSGTLNVSFACLLVAAMFTTNLFS